MSRKEIEAAVMDKAMTDMCIRMEYSEKEIRQEIQRTKTEDLLQYLED